jgi:hypothetical protein
VKIGKPVPREMGKPYYDYQKYEGIIAAVDALAPGEAVPVTFDEHADAYRAVASIRECASHKRPGFVGLKVSKRRNVLYVWRETAKNGIRRAAK